MNTHPKAVCNNMVVALHIPKGCGYQKRSWVKLLSKMKRKKINVLLVYFLIFGLGVFPVYRWGEGYLFAQEKERAKIVLFPLEDESKSKVKELSRLASDALALSLVQSDAYDVIDKELVEKELKGITGKIDLSTRIKVGKSLKAEQVVFGEILKAGINELKMAGEVTLTLRVLNVESEEVVTKVRVVGTSGEKPGYSGEEEPLIKEALSDAALKAVDEIILSASLEGVVLACREDKVMVKLGRADRLNRGAELGVKRAGKTIAQLRVVKVDSHDSEANIVYLKPGQRIESGDRVVVISNPSLEVVAVVAPEKKKREKKIKKLLIGILAAGAVALLITNARKRAPEAIPTPGDVTDVKAKNVLIDADVDGEVDDAGIEVSWSQSSVSTVTGYYVYRSEDWGVTWERIATINDRYATTFIDGFPEGGGKAKSLIESKSYKYFVTCFNSQGRESTPPTTGTQGTPALKPTTILPTTPNPPTQLVTSSGNQKVSLSWTAPTKNTDGTPLTNLFGYKIYRSTTSGVKGTCIQTVPQVTSYTDNGEDLEGGFLVNGTTYYYQITALNSDNIESEPSNQAMAVPTPVVPAMTVIVTANPVSIPANGSSTSTINATVWDAGTLALIPDGTEVTFSTTNGTLSAASATTANGIASVSLLSVVSTTEVTAKVTAKVGSYQGIVEVTFTGSVPLSVPPAAPQWADNNPVVPGEDRITLNWKTVIKDVLEADFNVDTPLASYNIYRCVADDFSSGAHGNYTIWGNVAVPTITYTDPESGRPLLVPENYYFYKVSAVLADGTEGPLSDYGYGQVGQPAIILYTPPPGAWIVGDVTVSKEGPPVEYEINWFADRGLGYSWSPVDGAARYILETAWDPGMVTIEDNIQVSATSTEKKWYTKTYSPSDVASNLFWRVTAVSDANVAIAISEVRAHTLAGYVLAAGSTLPNAPDLTSANGSLVAGQIELNWTAPTKNTDGSTLLISDIAGFYIYRSPYPNGPFYRIVVVSDNTETSYIDNAVVVGTTYYYKMSAFNVFGREGPQNSFAKAATPFADVPTGLSALPGDGRIDLSWSDSCGEGVTEYRIYRTPDWSPSGPKTPAIPTATIYTDAVVTNGTLYSYQVSAVKTVEGDKSTPVSARPLSTLSPSPPAGLTVAVDTTTTRIAVSWTAIPEGTYSDVTGYALYRDILSTGSFSEQVAEVTGQGSSTYINLNEADDPTHGVVNGVPYYYKITALGMNSNGGIDLSKESERSSAAPSGATKVNPYSTEQPPEPQWNQYPVGGNLSISMSWHLVTLPGPGNENLWGYYVWRDRGEAGEVQSSLLSRYTTSYIDTVPDNETTHYYQIEAVRYGAALDAGATTSSTIRSAEGTLISPPASPTWSDPAVIPCPNSLILNWSAAGGTVGVNIYRSDGEQYGIYALVGTREAPLNSWEDTGASDPAIIYYYKLKAYNTDNVEGQFSLIESGTPGAPGLILYFPEAGVSVPPGSIEFSWRAVQAAASYYFAVGNSDLTQLYNGGENVTGVGDVIVHSWDTSGQSGGTIYWRVTAYDASGSLLTVSEIRALTIQALP